MEGGGDAVEAAETLDGHAGGAEHGEVLRDGGGLAAEPFGEFADGERFAFAQLAEDGDARGVAEEQALSGQRKQWDRGRGGFHEGEGCGYTGAKEQNP